MIAAPIPSNEPERLAALYDSGALDPIDVLGLQHIAEAAAVEAKTDVGMVSFVSATRQWVRASVGAPFDTDRDAAFCAWAVYNADVLWVEDALQDPRFIDNPMVQGEPYIRHYAGAPIITPAGYVLGTVCVIDDEPRAFDSEVAPKLVKLAQRVSQVLETGQRGYGRRKEAA